MKTNTKTSNADTEIAELVTKHVNNLDDKGKLQLPDDMPDWQKAVIRAEKRTRDAQSELSKTQSSLRGLEAVNKTLLDTASTFVPADFELSPDEIKALEVARTSDPEKYRTLMNGVEQRARAFQATKLTDMTTKAMEEASTSFVAKNRITILQEFREANPDLVITDDVLVNDVPPRFMNQLNAGEYDYNTYLENVKAYLETGKNTSTSNQGDHNLHNLAGSNTPGKAAAENAGKKDYAKITF